ncbi:penicillin-binding protein 2 [Actinocrinis puniceicyclus]|uniref:Penicillin-binding protein 2 n=1 Tax=Actinocrinis puniceicyclus TaxID=977794 RepID=A0A8J7WI23_9ACTN|nr:penicillin-binding protein 2 [Actinocrinis puniceicyclus]MBS2961698.1 penicillin-binding protein 2 [Actinocrinis puniceicyclus]
MPVPQPARSRVAVVQVLVLALLGTLGARLWFLQVRSGAQFQQAAAANDLRSVVTAAVRGSILDDQGRALVDNRTVLDVTVDLNTLAREPQSGRPVLERLAAALGVPAAQIEQRARLCSPTVGQPCWTGSPYQPVPVARDVPTRLAVKIMEERDRFPGVSAVPGAQRVFPEPYGAQAAQVLGYLSPVTPGELDAPDTKYQPTDMVGRSGLEQTHDDELRGVSGVAEVAVDNLGRAVRTVSATPPVPGDDLVTTLDAHVQAVAEQQLAAAVKSARNGWDKNSGTRYKADSGAVVVLDVNTGGVVAMATYPSYDPSVWSDGVSAAQYARLTDPKAGTPLLDRAYQGQFAPGSTFKLVTASAMLQDGFPARGVYDCSPSFDVGSQSFHNFEGEAFGPITLKRAIEVSCDTVFYRAAYQMWLRDGGNRPVTHPADPVQTMAAAYGFGRATGIDLPGESPGDVQNRQEKLATWKQMKDIWCRRAQTGYPEVAGSDPARAAYLKQIAHENCQDGWQFRGGDAVIEAIGQGGILVTPLQLARAYAALANGGTLYQPHLEKAVIAPDGHVVSTYRPKVVGHVPVSPATRSFLVSAFEGVAQEGTASGVYGPWPQNRIAVGAKTGTADVYGKQATSVFASFLPADHPQYAVAMMVSQAGQGAMVSGPAVEKIEEALYGVQGGAINPRAALLPQPPATLPGIRPDGTLVAPADQVLPPACLPPPGYGVSQALPPAFTEPSVLAAPPYYLPERRYAGLFQAGALA